MLIYYFLLLMLGSINGSNDLQQASIDRSSSSPVLVA